MAGQSFYSYNLAQPDRLLSNMFTFKFIISDDSHANDDMIMSHTVVGNSRLILTAWS